MEADLEGQSWKTRIQGQATSASLERENGSRNVKEERLSLILLKETSTTNLTVNESPGKCPERDRFTVCTQIYYRHDGLYSIPAATAES